MSAVINTSFTTIPLAGRVALIRIYNDIVTPGWTHEVQPFRIHSNEGYGVWLLHGRPTSCPIFKEQQHSHTQYCYNTRRVKRGSKLQQAKNLFSASLAGVLQLLRKIRNIDKGKKTTDYATNRLNDTTDSHEILEKFIKVYQQLYNSWETKEGMAEVDQRF